MKIYNYILEVLMFPIRLAILFILCNLYLILAIIYSIQVWVIIRHFIFYDLMREIISVFNKRD